ncbi:MAG: FISUMP domain-containing protein [Bacteroidales bacterium]
MKKQILLSGLTFILIFLTFGLFAQVGINSDGSQPDPSAMLDVKSAVKGFLPPRVALTSAHSASPVASPTAIGLLVFNTVFGGTKYDTVVPGYYYWSGVKWMAVGNPQGKNAGDMLYWSGNSWQTIPSGQHGQQLSFCKGVPTWGGCEAIVHTSECSEVTQRSMMIGGEVADEGGSPVIRRGICWSTHEFPTVDDDTTLNGSGYGEFTSFVSGLSPNTRYYLRAYATNNAKTGYGEQEIDTTKVFSGAPVTSLPVMSACPGSNIDIPVEVDGFFNIGSFTLTLHYNSTMLTYLGGTNTAAFPGLTFNGSVPGEVTITGSSTTSITYPDNTVLFNLHFYYSGGAPALTWDENGNSCQYFDGTQFELTDAPASTYYLNGQVTAKSNVGAPVFTLGQTSTRCQAAGTITYAATASNSTGISYSLDAASIAAGNSINPNTGTVNYTAQWIGNSVITATAQGCNGPQISEHHAMVSQSVPVSVSVVASDNNVCYGTQVTFTATPVNSGSSPAYQWLLNGVEVGGATNAVYTYVPNDGALVSCKLISSIVCVSGNPAVSNVIHMVVNPILAVDLTITASANPACDQSNVTFTAHPVNGGLLPIYQWNVNGNDIPGATDVTYNYIPVNNDQVKCTLTSSLACVTGNPKTSNVIPMTVSNNLPVDVIVAASLNPCCAGTLVVFTATPVNGGTSPAYQWKVNGNSIPGATNATYSYVPLNDDLVTCVLTSNAPCVTGNPATSAPEHMVVNQGNPVSVTVISSSDTVCFGSPVMFTAIPVNGGNPPAYQWNVNGITVSGATNATYSYAPSDGDLVKCIVTSNLACPVNNPAVSNVKHMTVKAMMPVSVTITTPENPVCSGSNVIYTAHPVNGGTTPAYQWSNNGVDIPGATNATYSFNAVNVMNISCVLNSSLTCVTGNPATAVAPPLGIDPLLPVDISITASQNPVCQGTTVIYSSAIINGGSNPLYQWMVNSANVTGATNATFSYVPLANDNVSCRLLSNARCASGNPDISNIVPMGVTSFLSVGSISGTQTIFANMTPAPIIGVPPSNGTMPTYQMQQSFDNSTFTDISGATSLNYQPEILAQTTYYRQMQNATGPCGGPLPTNVVTITVNVAVAAGVSISSNPSGSFCAGTLVTFTAVPTNGGSSPSYQWKVNGVIAGTNNPVFTYAPQDDDSVFCIMTSSLAYATNNPAQSNVKHPDVEPILHASVTITVVPSMPVCAGTMVTFTATPTNGGTSPAYQWYNGVNPIPGATNATYSSQTLGTGSAISVVMTSNASPCLVDSPATSNIIVVTPSPILNADVNVSASPTGAICPGTLVTFTAVPVNGGTAPTYQWMMNGTTPINGATNSIYASQTLGNGTVITVVMTSNAAPCLAGSPATSIPYTMIVSPQLPVSVTITHSANPVCTGTSVTFTAVPLNGGTNPLYQWKLNGTNITGATNVTYAVVPTNGQIYSCQLTSSALCTTGNPAISDNDTIVVNSSVPVKASIVSSAYAVMPGTQITLTASVVNGGTSPTYVWKNNGVTVGTNSATYTYSPTATNDKITCTITSNSSVGCLTNNPATSNRLAIILYTTGTACTSAPTVSYGGLTYNTVQIGTQCWMRENLNIGTQINNTVTQTNNAAMEKYCYNDSTINCSIYGGLYQWNEMMQYVTTPGAQGICPTGWHVPTEAEFATLATYMGGATVAGGKLKEAGTGHFRAPNTGATNEYGFTALPTGYSYAVATPFYSNIYSTGYFHTSTDYALPNGPVFRSVSLSVASLGSYYNVKSTGHPVRCLKN